MFRFWLHFPPLPTLLGLAVIFAGAAALFYWLQCRSPLARQFSGGIPTASFPVAIAVMFSLFTGFLLANMVDQKNRALDTVRDEAQSLSLLQIASETAKSTGPAIRTAIAAYARSVLTAEWPAMVHESSAAETSDRLRALLRLVQSDAVAADVRPTIHAYMLSLAKTVADSRQRRITIVSNHLWQFAWSGLFALALLTQFSIALVHQDKPRVVAMTLSLFTMAVVIALWLIAVQDNPFRRGLWQVSPKPIEAVLNAPGGT
jgi:hypothetical protein